MSANMMVTMRRSSVVGMASGWPHRGQNLAPGGSGEPQRGQVRGVSGAWSIVPSIRTESDTPMAESLLRTEPFRSKEAPESDAEATYEVVASPLLTQRISLASLSCQK